MKNVIHMFILLLFSTAVLSCSAEMLFDGDMAAPGAADEAGFSLNVSGTVSDTDSRQPLEDMKITVTARENASDEKITTKTGYTDNLGRYIIQIGGFRSPTSFSIKVEDPTDVYKTFEHYIPMVSWNSDYNMENNVFYINECDFFLKKK